MEFEVKPRDYREAFWTVKDRLSGMTWAAENSRGVDPRDALRTIAEAGRELLEALDEWLEPTRCDEHSFSCVGPCECGAERQRRLSASSAPQSQREEGAS